MLDKFEFHEDDDLLDIVVPFPHKVIGRYDLGEIDVEREKLARLESALKSLSDIKYWLTLQCAGCGERIPEEDTYYYTKVLDRISCEDCGGSHLDQQVSQLARKVVAYERIVEMALDILS